MTNHQVLRKQLQTAPNKETLATRTLAVMEALPEYYQPLHQVAPHYPSIHQRLKFLETHAQGNILDIGCYDGFFSLALAYHHKVTGIDMLHACIAQANNNINGQQYKPTFQQSFAEALPFDNARFDTTIISHTLEHVFDDEQALKEAVRVTRPTGTIIVILPTSLGDDPTHLRYIPPTLTRQRLQKYGTTTEAITVGKGIGHICTKQ
ncbi:MAG: class I SAM-dependent methyltransferase [Nanoarchaeota archaeon]|nr:class I SAM-dependent methyltransferase [Nanoarchaeota archaeon]